MYCKCYNNNIFYHKNYADNGILYCKGSDGDILNCKNCADNYVLYCKDCPIIISFIEKTVLMLIFSIVKTVLIFVLKRLC